MGKSSFSFRRSVSRRRTKKTTAPPPRRSPPQPPYAAGITASPDGAANNGLVAGAGASALTKVKKKTGSARLWMRFDRSGRSELVEWEKNAIVHHAAIPARDLRILGPVFSHSSNILAREKAMVVNLEFIKAIVTAEEVLLLDPLRQEVLPFVEQLRQQLPGKSQPKLLGAVEEQEGELLGSNGRQWLPTLETVEGLQSELPFEFQVLEIALEAVCTYLDSSVADLERGAYPVLDELARNVSTKNLEHVRSLKSNLTRLLARVQKVRDEIEHLLDDNEDMAQLYLTRKWLLNQQIEEAQLGATTSNNLPNSARSVRRLGSTRSESLATSHYGEDNDVEDLEMLLDAYFMQLDGTRNKILSVREYIDDTEDYVNIQLDNHRNELIQLQLTLTIASFAIAIDTLVAGAFGMNIPCKLYDIDGIFWPFVWISSAACVLLFLLILAYARWKKLLGS
ncbi:magnesium transporter MRS2-4 [Vigna radiata var. radiata]|uniref:Magnesium transporter n=1 Tax=Vigna radiata var. radiata TaxID=3916 RepID=A0A1S3UWY0_VIGRR|nr:magnesium transporter MRS2-4 [Vigna radiata var. radiata]